MHTVRTRACRWGEAGGLDWAQTIDTHKATRGSRTGFSARPRVHQGIARCAGILSHAGGWAGGFCDGRHERNAGALVLQDSGQWDNGILDTSQDGQP